jgi:20S proteasome alpha/beta subunit
VTVVLPADWKERAERRMTICIAATCNFALGHRTAIMCVDWRTGTTLGAAEIGHKTFLVIDGWYCMYSGSPSAAHDLVLLLRANFTEKPPDEMDLLSSVRKALYARKQVLCEEYTQGKFGMSYQEFVTKGKVVLPENLFNVALQAIEGILLGVDTLIVGFVDQHPIIVETDQYCRAFIREGFAMVGDGSFLASASLMHRELDETFPLGPALYAVYEAKKWAQRNTTVGERTTLTIFTKEKGLEIVTEEGMKFFEEQFAKFGPKKLDFFSILPNCLKAT